MFFNLPEEIFAFMPETYWFQKEVFGLFVFNWNVEKFLTDALNGTQFLNMG